MISIPTPQSKVIIFDWDDTICPSSFVDQKKFPSYHELPLHYQNLMDDIGRAAEKCLAAAAKYGEVIIITNSDDGWVKYSAEKYLPNMLPILNQYRIVSARTNYEEFYPGQPLCWKAAAFAHEVHETFALFGENEPSSITDESQTGSLVSTDESSFEDLSESDREVQPSSNVHKKSKAISISAPQREIISFGDSMEERTAVKIVARQLTAMPKSVMFISCPTPIEIIGQLAMLSKHMGYVCERKYSLDLEISPQQAHKCADEFLSYSKLSSSPGRPIPQLSPRMRRVGM